MTRVPLFQKIRELSTNLAIYGLGDVAVSIVNFFLLPLFVNYLTAEDYGILGLLGSVEVIAKIVFRFGLDGSFMRLFYDCGDDRARQRLASTIFFFLLTLNGTVLAVALLASPALARHLFGGADVTALRLVLLNTFAIGFTFLPFHVLRMEQRSVTFSLLTLARSVSTIGLRIFLVIGLQLHVLGVVLADVIVTAALMVVLLRWFAPLIRPAFSRAILREALAFGVPRVPHAAAQQIMAVGDKFILTRFRPVSDIGVYSMAVSFGLTQKLFLSAFESAWAPFYYATIREPDAPRVFRIVTTYGIAVLALLTAGLSAIGRDVVAAMTHGRLLAPGDPRWGAVGPVVTWTAIGVFLQGVYLLTSIGLNIARRTRYYPVATITAAAANVALNFVLIPRFGIVGAAWANAAAYAVQAALGFSFSQHFYPIPYEWDRILRIAGAARVAYAAAARLPVVDPVAGVVVRGGAVIVVFAGLLALTGFFTAAELRQLQALRRRRPPAAVAAVAPDATELGGEIVATDVVASPEAIALPEPRPERATGEAKASRRSRR